MIHAGNGPSGESFVARACRLMAHRGPDDEGMFSGEGVVLGHRRLSIVDLTTAGHQPMTSPDGRFTIVYNGEVYNHETLRPALAGRWKFRSRSDTETVLAALALDGPAALESMVGMWALALWDARERRLLISRDRYGQKPLNWRRMPDGSFRCASEIAPLLDPGERPQLHAPAVAEFLAVGNYGHLGDRTFFRDVYSFPPGHWAWVDSDTKSLEPRRYWRFPVRPPRERRPYDAVARRQFRAAFEEAVSSQLMSDVPLAATLSGGLDSSAIVGAMASAGPATTIRVFTAQAEGSRFDESRYVEAVAAKWGSRLAVEKLAVERMPLSQLTPEVLLAQEEPFGDPSIIAHHLIVKAVRKAGISVLLGGQGGDEILLGYPFMSPAIVASELRRGRVAWALRELASLDNGARTVARAAVSAVWPSLERNARGNARLSQYHWLSPALREASRIGVPLLAAMSDLETFWLEGIEGLALPHLVHYDDRNGMRYSIEGRMPFLDHRLADVVTSIDPAAFLEKGRRKVILREACGDLLPPEVLARNDKIGFHTPSASLLRDEAAWVRACVCGEQARALGLYDVERLDGLCSELASKGLAGGEAGIVWRALAVMEWARVFAVDWDGARPPRKELQPVEIHIR